MDEMIDNIMNEISPLIAVELGNRTMQYLKDVVPGGAEADTQIIKLTKEALHELLDDIQGSISTDIDLAQANLETEIENDSFINDLLWPSDLPNNDLPPEVWDNDSEEAVIEKTKEVSDCQCSYTEPEEIIAEGMQECSLDYDWDDITYK